MGCGYVGSALANLAISQGQTVFAITRRGRRIAPGVTPVALDVTDEYEFEKWPTSASLVVYCVSAGQYEDEAYRAAYVDGVRNTVRHLNSLEQKPQRLVFVSSTGVYAQGDGETVNENSDTNPTHFSGRRLLEGEASVRRAKFSSTIIRLSGIYGPSRTSLIDSVKNGTACQRPNPAITNRIHRDDCAAAIMHLLQLENPEPVYIGTDDEPTDVNTVLCWISDQLGKPHPKWESLADASALRSNKRCSNLGLRNSGYSLIYPTFREGFRDLL